jgi:gamma-polyglutamate synthase
MIPLIAMVGWLVGERVWIERRVRCVPLRICVTGTRGKSSVTRMLASVLRRSGRKVLAKTTGSEARYILPDGKEAEVARSGAVSVLEQKRLVALGARLGVDCIVAEIMSIRPETHRAEAQQILKPNILAVTNVRRDHTEWMGQSETEIAGVLASTVCRGATVFLPGDVPRASFAKRAATIVDVEPEAQEPGLEFAGNLALVWEVSRHLGVRDKDIAAGIRETRHDAGRLRISVLRDAARSCYFVNAFAANDPESTALALQRVQDLLPAPSKNTIGILNLREDRVPRTLQWLDALNGRAAGWFRQLYITGHCPQPLRKRFSNATGLKDSSAEAATATILATLDVDCVVFGFGNFAGFGAKLARHWASIGADYGV